MALTLNATTANSMASTLATAIGTASVLEIRSGSKPSTPETAATGTLLVSITVGTWTASGGSITTSDPAATAPTASGTAGYFRIKTSGGTGQIDGTVGTSGADLILGSTTITTGVNVDLGVPTITVPVV